MSHDLQERPGEGLDDVLRERLHRLGRAATADSLPWPGVDRAIRRRRRTAAVGTTALATAAAVLAATALAGGLPGLGGSAAPAGPPELRSRASATGPWAMPADPYTPVYENVRVRLDTSTCGRLASLSFRDPTRVVTGAFPRDGSAGGDLSAGRPCEQPEVTTVVLGVPSESPGGVDPEGRTLRTDICSTALQGNTMPPDTGFGLTRHAEPAGTARTCAVVPAGTGTDEPALLVGVQLRWSPSGVDLTISAWTGEGTIPVDEPRPVETPVPAVSAPFTVAYEDVPLRLPGKPEACNVTSPGGGTYLDLHVPEVNENLGLSDAALTPPCPDPAAASLQLGEPEPRGVVLRDTQVTAEECADALADGERVNDFKPVVGTTLCIVSPGAAEYDRVDTLVALTVTRVDAETGAFDLSATGWTGQG